MRMGCAKRVRRGCEEGETRERERARATREDRVAAAREGTILTKTKESVYQRYLVTTTMITMQISCVPAHDPIEAHNVYAHACDSYLHTFAVISFVGTITASTSSNGGGEVGADRLSCHSHGGGVITTATIITAIVAVSFDDHLRTDP